MKWTGILKYTRWIAASLSVWTMSIAPVALGQESQKISEERLVQAVKALGLNKSMTLGQFWDQNKYLMPDRLQKQMEPYIKANRNQKMPTFEVIAGKTTSGDSIPTLRVTSEGELINLQWFGEQSKYLKFQNTNLSEVDLINFTDMYTRVVAGDEKYRKQIEEKPFNRFKQKFNYPSISEQQWKTMPNMAKAQYIVNLRTLWQDARAVLDLKNELKKNKPKKTSDYFYEKNRHFFETLLEQTLNIKHGSLHLEAIKPFYWPIGTHFYKPLNTKLYKNREEFVHQAQNPENGILVVGEAVSRNQGWTEGALESVEAVVTKKWVQKECG